MRCNNSSQCNETTTMNELVVDEGAFEVVYDAYMRWAKDHREHYLLPGLQNYTKNQAFWMGIAATLCEKDHFYVEDARARLTIGARNHAKFDADYNCVQSTMNPLKKCTFWT